MKILNIIPQLGMGGTANTVLRLVKESKGESINDAIVCGLGPERIMARRLECEDIAVSLNNRKGSFLHTLYRLYRYTRDFEPDIIHAHLNLGFQYAILLKGLVRRPIVGTIHYMESSEINANRHVLIHKLARKYIDRMIAVSEASAAAYGNRWGWGRDEMAVIHSGVDVGEWQAIRKRRKREGDGVRKEFGLDDNAKIVMMVGRFHEHKGHNTFIKAMNILKEDRDIGAAFIVGNKGNAEPYKRKVYDLMLGEKVRFLGGRTDIDRLMHAVDVVAIPSNSEALGMVALEAMRAGTPIVASDVDGLREVIVDGETGVLFRKGDPPALVSAIRIVIGGEKQAISLAQNAHARLRQRFNIRNSAVALDQVYREVLS